jgi:penicillin-binding protein 1A
MTEEAERETIHIPPKKEKEPPPILPEKLYRAVVTGFEGNNIKILVGRREGRIPHKGYRWARTFNPESAAYNDANYLNDPGTKFKTGDVINVRSLTPAPSPATTASADKPEGRGRQGEGDEFSLAQRPIVQGALFSLDPHTGEVKAMVGGYDFADSEFNRATQAVRQPGSSFKPFIYSAALDKGYKYTTPIMDSPVVYSVGVGQPAWAPKNYGNKFSGLTTFESDLIHSRNIPTVKIAHDIGLHYLTAYVRKMGLTTTVWKYLSMALGANGVYLSEMVPAYSTFAAGGIRPAPVYIKKIVDNDGKVLEEHTPKPPEEPMESKEVSEDDARKMDDLNTALFEDAQKYIEGDHLVLRKEELKILYGSVIPEGYAITPQTAYLMTRLLQEVVERGTGTRVKALGKPAAGKTGTTNDETDCWFIGFVPDLSAGVWVGFDNIAKIGGRETGGKTAAPIFLEYMKEATKDFEPRDFAPPEGLNPARAAQMTGGSAVYFRGYSFLREGTGGTQRMGDRAINFFEEDMAGGDISGGPASPASPAPRESSDDNGF